MKKLVETPEKLQILSISCAFLLVSLFGCAPPPPSIQLMRPGASYPDFRADALVCTEMATNASSTSYPDAATYQNCMFSKGWRHVTAGGFVPLPHN